MDQEGGAWGLPNIGTGRSPTTLRSKNCPESKNKKWTINKPFIQGNCSLTSRTYLGQGVVNHSKKRNTVTGGQIKWYIQPQSVERVFKLEILRRGTSGVWLGWLLSHRCPNATRSHWWFRSSWERQRFCAERCHSPVDHVRSIVCHPVMQKGERGNPIDTLLCGIEDAGLKGEDFSFSLE